MVVVELALEVESVIVARFLSLRMSGEISAHGELSSEEVVA